MCKLSVIKGGLMKLTVDEYLELQEVFTFKDLQFGSVNCYFNPNYYNNPLYFSPLTYEVEQ